MEDKIQYISQESHDNLVKELINLKNKLIPDIANRIDEAKQQGDLSENAEYHQAKEDMAWAQGRHIVIEQILNNSKIIEKNRSGDDIIEIGHIITVDANGKKKEYCIVGPQEADPFAGKISNESPLGQSFIGRKVGETVKVITPAGEQKFKILTIK
jgi:transcription elongation factor GreA